jgi:glycosyltransferase involved in cell wall biosynthesis
MNPKPPIFVISGKSPKGDSGGYPAYAYSLSEMLGELGYQVIALGVGKTKSISKDKFGEIRILDAGFLKYIPVLKHLALAGLPYYSYLFAKEIKNLCHKKKIKHFILWGMGPWAFPVFFLKLFPPKNVKMTLITSYFTSTRHEMKGAVDSIKVEDYGLLPKIRYLIVYEIVARIFHIFEKLTLDFCDIVVIHYNSSRRIINQYFHTKTNKVVSFPWYTEIFKRTGKGNEPEHKLPHPLVVSISRQDPRKGLNYIIRAMKIVADKIPNVKCLIVGTGSFYKPNKKLVTKLGLNRIIDMPGFVPDINPILKQADVVVIIPLRQGSSALTVFEAMSYGKAIVASNVDGIPEDLENNKSALIVPAANEKKTAEAIVKIISSPMLKKKLENNCQKRFKTIFGYQKTKKSIEDLLNKRVLN